MIGEFMNMDINLFLESGDCAKLGQGETLKTQLVDYQSKKPIGKEVSLKLGKNDGKDKFFYLDRFHIVRLLDEKEKDQEAPSWNSILGYDVTINQVAYDLIQNQGHTGTRYHGENKITVFNRE